MMGKVAVSSSAMTSPPTLFVTWRSAKNRRIYPVGRLRELAREPRWKFAYIEGSREAASHGFVPFVEFPDLDAVYRSDDLFPLFDVRVMSSTRPDYADHVQRLGLLPAQGSPMVILARSEGRSTTDRIELIAPPVFDALKNRHVSWFFSRGIRYLPEAETIIAKLRSGDHLAWSPEPENEHDPLAIALHAAGTLVGRVPFYLVDDMNHLMGKQADLDVYVERVNPAPAPTDQRLLCRLEARWSNGFVPFTSPRFEVRAKDGTGARSPLQARV